MEKIYRHIFDNELNIYADEHNVIISEVPLNYPKENREKMAEMMFENFSVPGLYIENQAYIHVWGRNI